MTVDLIHIDADPDAIECAELIARLHAEQVRVKSRGGMSSVGGWHTVGYRLGSSWLGQAVRRRLERLGRGTQTGSCWGNILPPGSAYDAHVHKTSKQVAVWCLTDSGGSLHIDPDTVIPDRAGQLVFFPGSRKHWVPTVERERITVAVNLE